MITSLVTGGAGFMGSHVVDCLVERGDKVVVLDDLSGGFRDNIHPGAVFIWGSVTDKVAIDNIFHEFQFDYIYHLAAYAAEGLSHFIRRFNYTNNLIGSINLINNAVKHDCKCFVFTSSIAVYGAAQTPMKEDTPPQPEDPYGIAKYAVELDLRAAHHQFGLNYVIFRPHNVYGERQNIGDPYRNVIGIFMNQILQGKPCTVFGDGEQTRAFTHISDVAPVIARSVHVPQALNRVYNVGADVPYSVNELLIHVQSALGKSTTVVYLPPRNEVVHAFSDHLLARHFFGTHECLSLHAGLKRMSAWAKDVGIRRGSGKIFDAIEVNKNMPESWRKLC